jgi:hypothetical protein
METTPYKKALELIEKQKCDILDKLYAEILALPDNPAITRISSNSFTVNSAQIAADGGIMSASHYDFKKQYELLADKLLQTSDISALEKALAEGNVRADAFSRPVTLHKTVIANVQKLIEGA